MVDYRSALAQAERELSERRRQVASLELVVNGLRILLGESNGLTKRRLDGKGTPGLLLEIASKAPSRIWKRTELLDAMMAADSRGQSRFQVAKRMDAALGRLVQTGAAQRVGRPGGCAAYAFNEGSDTPGAALGPRHPEDDVVVLVEQEKEQADD